MPYRFLVLERNVTSREVRATGDEIWIGRTPGFPIALRDRWVSRRHAVVRQRKGALLLEDAGSRTGTIVNGRRIMPGQAVHLCGGDVIVCGASSLVCCVVSPTASGTRTADAAAELNARAARANGRLLVVAHESIRCWPVTKASTVLGRSPACDIHLPYQGVAPSHARIIHTDCGFLLQNTTFHFTLLLNGRTVTAAPLQTNSAIVLGSVQLLFAYDLEPDGTRVRAAIDRLPRRTVCRYLMRHAHVPSDQLARLMKERVKSNAQLGEVAVRRGYITPASWRAICDSALRERTNYTRALDRIRRLFWRFRP